MNIITRPAKKRRGCIDIFYANMVKGDYFSEGNEIPYCPTTMGTIPKRIIPYDEAKKSKDYEATVAFYKDDYKFDGEEKGIWANRNEALKILSRFAGVITPDFSTYQDFPFPIKIYNTYRMRAYGFWLVKNGLQVVNNVRWGGPETWSYCFDGIPKQSMVAISTVGCIKRNGDRERYKMGLAKLVEVLEPHTILVYGNCPNDIFKKYKDMGINIVAYESQISRAMRGVTI